MDFSKNNFTDKSILDFNESDTLFIIRVINGFQYSFFIKFKKYEKGMVTGNIIEIHPNNITSLWIGKELFSIGDEISSRISKCCTKDGSNCKWFQKYDGVWKCKKVSTKQNQLMNIAKEILEQGINDLEK